MGCLWRLMFMLVFIFGLWLCREVWFVDKWALLYLGPTVVLCLSFCYARALEAAEAARAKIMGWRIE